MHWNLHWNSFLHWNLFLRPFYLKGRHFWRELEKKVHKGDIQTHIMHAMPCLNFENRLMLWSHNAGRTWAGFFVMTNLLSFFSDIWKKQINTNLLSQDTVSPKLHEWQLYAIILLIQLYRNSTNSVSINIQMSLFYRISIIKPYCQVSVYKIRIKINLKPQIIFTTSTKINICCWPFFPN